jgi:hypothetical protein
MLLKGAAMPIKVYFGPNGPYAECDSPRDALELLRAGGINVHSPAGKLPAPKSESSAMAAEATGGGEDSRALRVFEGINATARKLLNTLLAFEDGAEAIEVSSRSGIAVVAFGGILGGISKIAKKNQLDISDFVFSEARFEGSRRFRFLKPGPKLIAHTGQLAAASGKHTA